MKKFSFTANEKSDVSAKKSKKKNSKADLAGGESMDVDKPVAGEDEPQTEKKKKKKHKLEEPEDKGMATDDVKQDETPKKKKKKSREASEDIEPKTATEGKKKSKTNVDDV